MTGPALSPVREWEIDLLSRSFPELVFEVNGSKITAADGFGAVTEANSAREMLCILGERVRTALMGAYPSAWPMRERTGSPVR